MRRNPNMAANKIKSKQWHVSISQGTELESGTHPHGSAVSPARSYTAQEAAQLPPYKIPSFSQRLRTPLLVRPIYIPFSVLQRDIIGGLFLQQSLAATH